MKTLTIIIPFLFLPFLTLASDHIDGAPTIANGQADLTDLYAFPTPNKENSMTVILNMYPGVSPSGHFSSKVNYEIGIREIEKNSAPTLPGFKVYAMNALDLRCSFEDPGHHHSPQAKNTGRFDCSLYREQDKISELFGVVGKISENTKMKIFAGPRRDAFFLSYNHFQDVVQRRGFKSSPAGSVSNIMYTINILSIAVELNLEMLGLDHGLLAVSGQSLDAKTGSYLDRVGRPEITNLSLHDFSGNEPIKRSYNQLYHFGVAQSAQEKFKNRLVENISAYDLMDGIENWDADDLDLFTQILVEDFLTIDLDGACIEGRNEFLSIEKSLVTGEPTTSCGGRLPADDIMATLTATYIGGIGADFLQYGSGVTIPYQGDSGKSLSADFPYLAPAGKTTLKQSILLGISKKLQE